MIVEMRDDDDDGMNKHNNSKKKKSNQIKCVLMGLSDRLGVRVRESRMPVLQLEP